jgi:outer membrane protein OmpU
MNKITKVGITALAGSLVTLSAAVAGALDVSGGARLSYVSSDGTSDTASEGSRFGMQHTMYFNGSGEMDNGWNVSLIHSLQSDATAGTTSALTVDMGALGALRYNQNGSDIVGISGVNDIIPTAFEQYDNGLSPALSGEANIGFTGFDYSVEAMDGVKVGIGYSPSNGSARVDDGVTSGAGGTESGRSLDVDINLIDGLRVVLATAQEGDSLGQSIDQTMYGAVYTYGPVSVGYQNTDRSPETSSAQLNTDRTQYSVAFNVNENLSVSYGEIEVEVEGQAYDHEMSGIQLAYTMGSMSLRVQQNTGDNMTGSGTENTRTELELNFAF